MVVQGRDYLQAKTIRGKEPATTAADALAALSSRHEARDLIPALKVKHASQKAHLRALHRDQFGHWLYLLQYGCQPPRQQLFAQGSIWGLPDPL